MKTVLELAKAAKIAAGESGNLTTELKNNILHKIAEQILVRQAEIIAANNIDITNGEKNNMSAALIDRLRLTPARIEGMAVGARQVADLPDPIGEVLDTYTHQNGLIVKKVRVPIGVIGIIFESRPNVTLDAAILCLKSGNATVLRGGKEAINSNKKITEIMRDVIGSFGVNPDMVCLIEDISRSSAVDLMNMRGIVDILIPRGGASLIQTIVENSKIPVIETGVGNCHIFVDETADFQMALQILINAKCSRPSVCNAAETLLVSEKIAADFLPLAKKELDENNVKILGCEKTREIIDAEPATEEDFYKEFNDLIITIRVVSDIDEAISHIKKYGSLHSESIVTKNLENAEKFLNFVDAAAVYFNASTRFTDGFEFGLGAEIGISTQKLHARGPMGLKELTTIKYKIYGEGQIR